MGKSIKTKAKASLEDVEAGKRLKSIRKRIRRQPGETRCAP